MPIESEAATKVTPTSKHPQMYIASRYLSTLNCISDDPVKASAAVVWERQPQPQPSQFPQNDGLTVRNCIQVEFVTALVHLVQPNTASRSRYTSHTAFTNSPTPTLPYHTHSTDLFDQVRDLQSYLCEAVEYTDSDKGCRFKVLRARLNEDKTKRQLRSRFNFSNPYTALYIITKERNARNERNEGEGSCPRYW